MKTPDVSIWINSRTHNRLLALVFTRLATHFYSSNETLFFTSPDRAASCFHSCGNKVRFLYRHTVYVHTHHKQTVGFLSDMRWDKNSSKWGWEALAHRYSNTKDNMTMPAGGCIIPLKQTSILNFTPCIIQRRKSLFNARLRHEFYTCGSKPGLGGDAAGSKSVFFLEDDPTRPSVKRLCPFVWGKAP